MTRVAEGGVAGETRVIRLLTRVTIDGEGDINILFKWYQNVRLVKERVQFVVVLVQTIALIYIKWGFQLTYDHQGDFKSSVKNACSVFSSCISALKMICVVDGKYLLSNELFRPIFLFDSTSKWSEMVWDSKIVRWFPHYTWNMVLFHVVSV